MTARSLRMRLLAGAAFAIFVALAIAWIAMSYLFERHAQRQIQADLIARGVGVIASLTTAPDGALTLDPLPTDPRFRTPASGLYWQVGGEGVLLRSRSLWDETLTAPAAGSRADWARGEMDGPFGQRLVFVERRVQLEPQSPPLIVLLGADHAAVIAARDAFSRELLVFLALLWAVLAIASWAQVELGLKPLEHVRAAVGALRRQASARLAADDYPAEVAPLANAINELAEARQQDLEQAQRRAADLAHSLKTPLAALAAQSRRAREAGAGDAADGLDRALAAARRAVERELARARAAAARGAGAADARAALARLIQVLERTDSGARVRFDNEATGALPIAEDVLLELAGPLLENAVRHARARIRISGDDRRLTIEDDGPGLSEAEAAAALERGWRLDESGDGHGLGLAIAQDVARASGAAMTLTRSALGGLQVNLVWPTPP